MRSLIPPTILVAALALTGCRSFVGCDGSSDVGEGGKSIPPLRVPVGMAEPSKKEALTVPELAEPELPRDSDKCLDQPPSYFPDRRVGAESRQETEANRPERTPDAAPVDQPETPPNEN